MAKKNDKTTTTIPKANNLDQYEESIKSYGDKIKQLSFVEAVRHLPGLYIGEIGNGGWNQSLTCMKTTAT